MKHIDRIVWKPINWYPESPDQYPDRLPPAKPETEMVQLDEGRWLWIDGLQLGGSVDVTLLEGENTHLHTWPNGQITRSPRSGTWHFFDPENMSPQEMADWFQADRGFPDGPRVTPVLSIPADRVQDVVNALLYVHRRTHEHEYTGPDAWLPTDEGP
jgi:hypothetical protein